MIKSLPKGTTNIQIDNVRGGNVPNYMFDCIIPTEHLQGKYEEGATCFKQYNVEELNITLRGNSVSGYPIKVTHGSLIYPLFKLNETTGRYDVYTRRGPCFKAFEKLMWIWSHKYEAEMTSRGWIGVNLKLKEEYTVPMSIVIWIVFPNALPIDKYHQIEKINLWSVELNSFVYFVWSFVNVPIVWECALMSYSK